MNKDQVKGKLKDAAGKVQETTGKVIGQYRAAAQRHQEASRRPDTEGGWRHQGSRERRQPEVGAVPIGAGLVHGGGVVRG